MLYEQSFSFKPHRGFLGLSALLGVLTILFIITFVPFESQGAEVKRVVDVLFYAATVFLVVGFWLSVAVRFLIGMHGRYVGWRASFNRHA